MSELFRILEIGKKALRAHQGAMNTIGHNIANVNTKGFSRQRVNLTPSRPLVLPQGIFGMGVEMESIQRIRSSFIDQQIIHERASFGQYEFLAETLQLIESIFNEPSEFGLNRMLADFFNAFHDLANEPESNAVRIVVKEKAVTLANGFNRLHSQLSNNINLLNKELRLKVDEINRLNGQIAELNKEISSIERDGREAPDLRDQRDRLIEELSKLINIKTNENEAGIVSIAVGSRFLLVETQAQKLTLDIAANEGNGPKVIFEGGKAVDITKGVLKGLLDIRDKIIPDYLKQLDDLAKTIAAEVNALHRKGFNLLGETNVNFFAENVTGARDFTVSSPIIDNPDLIATASALNAPGDNRIALAIANLQSGLTMQNGTASFSDFYNSLVTTVGSQTQEANFFKNNFDLVLNKLENSREAISGVSLDEEMANMIVSQQAYTAAARFISTIDEMTQTILNML